MPGTIGNRTRLTYPTGQVVTYTHDADNRLIGVADWDGGQTVYGYDGAGRLVATTLPNGVVTVNEYDDAGRLVRLTHTASNETLLADYGYELDGVGNRVRAVETLSGTTRVITYTYDPLNRLTGADYSTGEQFGYAYDEVGNRTVMTDATGVTTYTHDAANRLTSAGGVPYTWDARGNLIDDGTFTYAYDAAGRMVQVESVTLTLVYTYNASGLLVMQSVDDDVTTFAWDWATGVPEMLSDGDNLYLVGHDTLGQWDGGTWAYYLHDALGSVRQETNAAGTVTGSREWTPYGVEVGTVQAGIGYAGEWQDPDVGLLYLRARWLDPSTGQFLSRDPWVGTPQRPRSFQPYLYASDSPVMYVDPLGLYNCFTDEQWAPELVGLCWLLDTSPEARNVFYRNGLVFALGVVGYQDAKILFEHWLGRTGETMYLGSRLVRLIERDTGSLIKESRQIYLEDAAQLMRGRAGNLPRGYDEDFLSNARGIPTWYAIPYPISEEVFIALGGVWFKRHYRGTVKKENQSTYRISLWTEFAIDKEWTFAPNEEMGLTENPPPEFNLLDTIGLPGWLPRPVLVHSPAWALLEHLLGARIPLSIGNPWSVYIPDEWAYALEQDGYATPFLAKGRWAHQEEFRAVDRNCDGWDVSDIVGEPKIVHELLPTGVDPAPSMSYGGVLDR